MTTVTTIDLLRHGEPEGGQYYRGSTNDPLTKTGWQQMHAVAAKQQKWDIIISSPLIRCLAFARELSASQQLPLTIEENFREMDFGLWEGKTAAEISQCFPNALDLFYDSPFDNPPEQGENPHEFFQRTTLAWQQTLTRFQSQAILIITHAGVIRMLFAKILGISLQNTFHIKIDYASLTRFQCFHSDSTDYSLLISHASP